MVPVSPPSSKLILSEVVCLSAHKIAKDSALMACPLCCIPAPSIPPHSVLLRHFQLFRARSRHAVTMLLPRVCSTINCHPLDRRLLQYSCLANVRIRICMCIYIIGFYNIKYTTVQCYMCVCVRSTLGLFLASKASSHGRSDSWSDPVPAQGHGHVRSLINQAI